MYYLVIADNVLRSIQGRQPWHSDWADIVHEAEAFFVKTLQDRDVCYCKHHTKLIMLKDAFNQMRLLQYVYTNCECSYLVCCLEFDLDEEEVQFNVCSTHVLVYKGITDLWEACLCPKQEGTLWYGKTCLMGECSICGVEKFLPLCTAEKERNTLV